MSIPQRAQKALAEIDAALALAGNATPGPWEHIEGQYWDGNSWVKTIDRNATFIAASRTLLPASLRMLKTAIEGLLRMEYCPHECLDGNCPHARRKRDIAALTTILDQWEAAPQPSRK